MTREGKTYDPEIQLRASEKFPGQFYCYVNDYVIEQLGELYEAAKTAQEKAKGLGATGVGPLTFRILNDEDQTFYLEKRKFKYAPDGVIRFRLPKQEDTQF